MGLSEMGQNWAVLEVPCKSAITEAEQQSDHSE